MSLASRTQSTGSTAIRWIVLCGAIATVVVGIALIIWRRSGADRRNAITQLSVFNKELSGTSDEILRMIAVPPAVASKSTQEQMAWLRQVLDEEISEPGIAAIDERGNFGPLEQIFPDEAQKWARAADVPIHECVAFRLERNGVRAEIVLRRSSSGLRIVRCNNVKQMAP